MEPTSSRYSPSHLPVLVPIFHPPRPALLLQRPVDRVPDVVPHDVRLPRASQVLEGRVLLVPDARLDEAARPARVAGWLLLAGFRGALHPGIRARDVALRVVTNHEDVFDMGWRLRLAPMA